MKKLMLMLIVAAISAPLYAAGTIDFTATDAGGVCTVSISGVDPCIPPVAMGLNIEVDGADPCDAITAVSGIDSFFDIYMDYAYDDPCTYGYGDGNPIADPCAAGSATLPSLNFCISMGGLGGETDPDEKSPPTSGTIFVLKAGNNNDPCNPVTGTISINALRGGVIGTDTETMTTNLSIPFTITAETDCVKSTAAFYAEWVGAGKNWDKPDCWCYERQCRGDADGCKVGLFRVQTDDLVIFANAYTKGDLKMDQTLICGDLDHKKVGLFRCQTDDLVIFANYYTKGDLKNPVCPMDWEATYSYPMTDPPTPGTPDSIDDYNFWIVPTCP